MAVPVNTLTCAGASAMLTTQPDGRAGKVLILVGLATSRTHVQSAFSPVDVSITGGMLKESSQ